MVERRGQMAVVAWIGHYPGLWMMYRFRLDEATRRLNGRALGATVVVSGLAWAVRGGAEALVAYVLGHVVRGTVLARLVYLGRAGTTGRFGD